MFAQIFPCILMVNSLVVLFNTTVPPVLHERSQVIMSLLQLYYELRLSIVETFSWSCVEAVFDDLQPRTPFKVTGMFDDVF